MSLRPKAVLLTPMPTIVAYTVCTYNYFRMQTVVAQRCNMSKRQYKYRNEHGRSPELTFCHFADVAEFSVAPFIAPHSSSSQHCSTAEIGFVVRIPVSPVHERNRFSASPTPRLICSVTSPSIQCRRPA